MAKDEIVIDVKIEIAETEEKLGNITGQIYDLKEQNKQLSKQLKEEGADYKELTKQIALNKQEIKSLQVAEKDLIGNLEYLTKTREESNDSIRQMEAYARSLEAQYKSLTKAERESERGEQLRADLDKAKQAVNEINRSLGNFQDQVGNYALAGGEIGGANDEIVQSSKSVKAQLKEITLQMQLMASQGNDTGEEFDELAKKAGKLKDAINATNDQIKTFTAGDELEQKLIIMKGGFEGAIGGASVLEGTMQLFGSENENVTKGIQRLVAIQSIQNGVTEVYNALQKESAFMAGVLAAKEKALATSKLIITNLTRIFGITSAQAWAVATLGVSVLITGIILLISNFNSIIRSVKEFFGISQNFDKVNESINKNVQALKNYEETTSNVSDRLKALGKSDREILDYKKDRYNEELRLQTSLYTNIRKKGDEATEEEKKVLEDATKFLQANASNRYKIQTEYIALNRKEHEDAEKKKIEDIKKVTDATKAELQRRKEIYKSALDASRALEDAQNEAIKDATEKAIEIEKDATRRKVEDLRTKLAEDKTLNSKAKEDIQATIEQIEKNSIEKQKKIKEDGLKAQLDKELQAEQKRLQNLLEIAEKGSKNELDLKLKAIEVLRKQELNELELTGKEKKAINDKYNKQIEEANKENLRRANEEKRLILENEFAEIQLKLDEQNANEVLRSKAELEQEQAKLDALVSMNAKTKSALYESEEAYNSAVIASKQAVLDKSQEVIQKEQELLEKQVASVQEIGNAISGVLSEVAGDSKEALVFQKFIALANASLNLATAISAATAASIPGDGFTMIARIAANVGAVIVSFAQVTKAINSTNIPNAPKFAHGGIVSGNSFSGDRIPALVNSGEMIINTTQQAKLFDLIANGGLSSLGGGIDYNALASAMSKQPAPILNYSEFTQFQQKIVTFDEITKI